MRDTVRGDVREEQRGPRKVRALRTRGFWPSIFSQGPERGSSTGCFFPAVWCPRSLRQGVQRGNITYSLFPIAACTRDHRACELGDLVPDGGSVLCISRYTPAHLLNNCLEARISVWRRNDVTAAAYHHVIEQSVNFVRGHCGLGEENLRIHFEVHLKAETLRGLCWPRDGRRTLRLSGIV